MNSNFLILLFSEISKAVKKWKKFKRSIVIDGYMDDINQVIEELKQQNEELRRRNKALSNRIEELESKIKKSDITEGQSVEASENEISRRSFLKKLGAGAIGLGALSLPVASKVTITDSSVKKDGSDFWFSGLSSNYDLSGQNITDSGTTVWDTSNSHIPQGSVEKTGFDADSVDGYDIQKNGSDTSGVINFKT